MQQDMQEKYDDNFTNLIKQIPNNKYVVEITKCCNYSTFVLVNKRGTLLDLYKEVSNWFECRTLNKLYLKSPDGDTITIPMTDIISMKEYIRTNQALFAPIYPIPNWVVYRIYLDDGHTHSHTEECKA